MMGSVHHVVKRIKELTAKHLQSNTSKMANPYQDLRLAIEAGDIEETARLLNDDIVISAENFREATVRKDYSILKLLLSKGWNINNDINDSVPSALV
jgi:hypothetical protein